MAISFIEKGNSKIQKKQKNMLFVLGFLVGLLIFLLINQGYVGKIFSLSQKKISVKPFKKIEINFDILKDSTLEGLQPFEKIEPYEIKEKKRNPFLPD